MNEPTSTDNYVQIGDKVINRTVDASVTTDDVQLSDRVFVFKKNDDGSIKTVVNTTIQYVVDAFGADAVATKNEVVTLKNDVITLKEQASTYASNASESADTATTKASEASESATKAKASEENASVSEANAKASETNAKTSETNASVSEANAKDSETNAKTSETKASTSEANAKASETNAKTSETNAKTSETNAKTSETNAKTSETNAKTSETNAKTSETNAGSSASSASTSASNAAASATTASSKATEASAFASKAEEAKNSARLWAISETIVDNEDYSSKYYAGQAKTSEANASTKATEASDSATSASTYKDEAESARDLAKQYRDEAETLSQSLCYFRKQTYAVSASAGDTSITIPSEAQYRSGADILFVHNKGVYLKEGTDYTKTDTGITLTNALEVATTIEIDILRAVSTDSQSYDLLKGDKGDKGEDGSFSKAQLLDMIYPVGAIYTSIKATSPASTLGGTWTAIEGDRVLYSVSEGTADLVDEKGNPLTGGSATHSHTITVAGHALSVNEMPAHTHGVYPDAKNGYPNALYLNASSSGGAWNGDRQWSIAVKHNVDKTTYDSICNNDNLENPLIARSTGNGGTHSHTASSASASNIPPYIKVYMWRRTA